MSDTPRVSVLVPVYGAERFMRTLLEDLVAQTIFEQTEIIVIDTASPTGEGAIVREYQARHPNIVYLRTGVRENAAAAYNRGVEHARGRYLAVAAADDRHRPDAFERLAAALDAHPDVALAYADCAITLRENERFGTPHLTGHFYWPEFDARLLFQVCYVGPQPMYRREVHARHGLMDADLLVANDYEYWLRLVARGERFLHVNEVLGLYLNNARGTQNSNLERTARESESVRLRHWPAGWGEPPAVRGGYYVPIAPGAALDREPPQAVAPAAAPRGGLLGRLAAELVRSLRRRRG